MTRLSRNLFAWVSYDFANAFAVIVFGLYFSEWLVVRQHVSDLAFNLIFVLSSLLLVLTAPVAGVITDKIRVKLPSLKIVTVYSFLSLLLVGLLAVLAPPTPLVIRLVIVLLILGHFCYQFSYVFYNPMLKDLGPEEEQPRISAIGQASAGLGQIAGLLIMRRIPNQGGKRQEATVTRSPRPAA